MHKLGQDFASTLQAIQPIFQFFPFTCNNRIFSEQHSWIVPSNRGKHCILKLRDVLVQHVVLDYQWNLISQTVTGNLQVHTNYIQIHIFNQSIFLQYLFSNYYFSSSVRCHLVVHRLHTSPLKNTDYLLLDIQTFK